MRENKECGVLGQLGARVGLEQYDAAQWLWEGGMKRAIAMRMRIPVSI